jgi:hypothetical protein
MIGELAATPWDRTRSGHAASQPPYREGTHHRLPAPGSQPLDTCSRPLLAFALDPTAADDGGVARTGEERCKHGEITAWCGESECMATRKGFPARVWRTPHGSAYHRRPTCQALIEGHHSAERHGQVTHPAESVPLSVAMSEGLGECFYCFLSTFRLEAKPCQVLLGSKWVDGFLLEWRRGADGRWKGLVNYRDRAARRVALKDQAELKPVQG